MALQTALLEWGAEHRRATSLALSVPNLTPLEDNMTELSEPSLPDQQLLGTSSNVEQPRALEAQLVELRQALEDLQEQFSEKITRDDAKRLLISKVVERMEKLESDFLFREFRKKLFLDVIMLYDRVVRLSKDKEWTDLEDEVLGSIATEILQVLKQQCVVRVVASSSAFDESIQEALDVVETSDESMDATVSEILRDGFVYRDVLLRPQGVVVRTFRRKEANDE